MARILLVRVALSASNNKGGGKMRVRHVVRKDIHGRLMRHEVCVSELPDDAGAVTIDCGKDEMRARQCAAEIRDAINTATGASIEYETVER